MAALEEKSAEEKAEEAKNITDSFMRLEKLAKISGLEKSDLHTNKHAMINGVIDIESFKRTATRKHADLNAMGFDTKEKTEKYIDSFLISELETLYDELDINGNEFLQAEEILWTFHQFGYLDVTLEECVAVCEEFTGQRNLDIITLHDFKGGMYDYMKHGTTDQHLKMVFGILDHKNKGIVGPTGLIRLFARFGIEVQPYEVHKYVDCIDIKKTGFFDFAQFKIFCTEFDLFGKLKDQFDTLVRKEAESTDEDEPKASKF